MKKTSAISIFISTRRVLRSVFFGRKMHGGFTLVETLVAIAIIMVAITGPYASAAQAIAAARIARDHTIATFLAQEGIEIVRAERDKVYLHDCFTTTGCSGTTVWWNNDFANSRNSTFGEHNIFQCSSSNSCILDTSKSGQYSNYTNVGIFEGMLKTSSSKVLHLKQPTPVPFVPAVSFLYDYTSTAPVTPFMRTIYASVVSNTEIKITSKVTWKDNGKTLSVTATDHLTPWFTQ